MNKIKSNLFKGNKHFFWGFSFLVVSLFASIFWGMIYAEDPVVVPPVDTTTTGGTITTIDITVKPTAPTNLTARVDDNKVILNWVDNSNNEVGFKIYRGPIWTDIGNVGANVTTFTDSGRPAGTYTYRLNAFNSSYLYSSISNDVTVTVTGKTTMIPPTNPVVTSPTITKTTTTPPTVTSDTTDKTATTNTTTPVVATSRTVTDTTAPVSNTGGAIPPPPVATVVVAPVVVETPASIIDNVTAALNIIPAPFATTSGGEITSSEVKKDEVTKSEVAALVYKDTNKDGISDYDSTYIYNIDPVKPSPVSRYEGKNINAGEKILLGFDPTKETLSKVVAEAPAESKSNVVVSSYKVQEVALTPKKEITLKGQALPNSFITLYIYSTPIMVTVKTNSNGEWQYTLDKELENGKHTVYAATVNNTGNIVAKSSPYNFVKTAEAVTLQDLPFQGVPTVAAEKPSMFQTKDVFVVVIISLMLIGIILILIGLFSNKTEQKI